MLNEIKKIRIQKGLTQIELSKKSKVKIRQLQRYESNQRQTKISETLAIANVLEIYDIRTLFIENDILKALNNANRKKPINKFT